MPRLSMCALGTLRSRSLWQDRHIFFFLVTKGCKVCMLLQQLSIPDTGRHMDCRCSQTSFQRSLFRTPLNSANPSSKKFC